MKKVFGQTVRDIKREVNKKVLKVPGIEQKVLDATSNEPWGPHGSLLADIAQATRNYHEYQMIMTVIWKRINDTGKNWRHVYKALTVLEYLVAHGAERVIDEIREHAYQISTLSDFQYIDSSGRDQGNNVRRKSQSLVQLVNDKERIIEVRQKAAANRDKFRPTSTGGMYRPGSSYGDRYDDDRYGGRDDDRNGYGYGREREWGYRDDDQSNRDGDRNGGDYEERYGKDGYRDDDYRGRSQSVNDYQYGSRSKSSDRDQDRNYDDNGQHSSGDSNVKAEDRSLEARLEQKFSTQNHGPPSYEEAVGEVQSTVHNEKDGETSAVSAPRGSFPNVNENPSEVAAPSGSSPPLNDNPNNAPPPPVAASTSENLVFEAFDEFDPRGPTEAAPTTSNNLEMDFLGSLSESFSSNALALVPATSVTTTSQANAQAGSNSAATFAVASSAPNNVNQPFEDPFGDSPFKAIPSNETAPSNPQIYQNVELPQSNGPNAETVSNFGFGDSFSGATFSTSGAANAQPFSTNSQFSTQDLSTAQQETDILADILPPAPLPVMASHEDIAAAAGQPSPHSFSAAQPTSQFIQQGFSAPTGQPAQQAFSIPSGHIVPLSSPTGQPVQQPFSSPTGQPSQQPFSAPSIHSALQPFSAPTGQPTQQHFAAHTGQPAQSFSAPTGQPAQQPFSSPTGQPAQQPFLAHTGQPAQQPFSAHTVQPAQQPFSAHTVQPPQQPFSAPTGHQPTQQPFSAHTGQPAQQPFSAHTGQPAHNTFSHPTNQSMQPSFLAHGGQPAQPTGNIYGGYHSQLGSVTPGAPSVPPQSQNGQITGGMFHPPGSTAPIPSHIASQTPTGQVAQNGNYFPEQGGSITHTNNASQFNGGSFVAQEGTATPFSLLGQAGANAPNASQYAVSSSTASNSIVPQPSKDKFETKSTVWADTLSRGLVNLNISGPKINPLADIGIDFDAINRKEKRMERPTTTTTPTTVTSTVTMGKAMGSGSGIGRAGASVLRAPSNPMMGQGMNMGMGMGNNPGIGMGMGGYGAMNPSMGMGMGGMGMGMGMNMGMGQGVQMQQPTGFPPGSKIPANYNNSMGAGGYSQQPYGGGYQ